MLAQLNVQYLTFRGVTPRKLSTGKSSGGRIRGPHRHWYYLVRMSSQNPGDQPFQHYTAKHRVVAWVSQRLFDNVSYTVRHGLLKGMKRKGGLAWLPEFISGSAKTPEELFWMGQDFKGLTVYDVGAFHGLLTCYFARQARQVISYEPNTRNHARLLENLRLNGIGNVTVRKLGIGSKHEVLTMLVSPLMPGGASVESASAAGIRNSNLVVEEEEIVVSTLDEDIREMSLPAPDFVKIDIEGWELSALTGARNTLLAHKPRLFLEMHGETMTLKRQKAAAIVDFLQELGYRDILHIESNSKISNSNSALAAQGHLYCK